MVSSYHLIKKAWHKPKLFFEISSGLQLSSKLLASYKILSKRIRYLKVQPSPYYISDSPYCKFLNGSWWIQFSVHWRLKVLDSGVLAHFSTGKKYLILRNDRRLFIFSQLFFLKQSSSGVERSETGQHMHKKFESRYRFLSKIKVQYYFHKMKHSLWPKVINAGSCGF